MSASTLKVCVTDTTAQAVRIVTEQGTKHWLPRSVCENGDEIEVDDTDLVVKDWWLRKEGLL